MNEKNVFHREKARLPCCMKWANRLQVLGPVHTYPDIFENGHFFSVLAFRAQTAFSGTKNAGFQKRSLEWSFFENAGLEGSSGRTKT